MEVGVGWWYLRRWCATLSWTESASPSGCSSLNLWNTSMSRRARPPSWDLLFPGYTWAWVCCCFLYSGFISKSIHWFGLVLGGEILFDIIKQTWKQQMEIVDVRNREQNKTKQMSGATVLCPFCVLHTLHTHAVPFLVIFLESVSGAQVLCTFCTLHVACSSFFWTHILCKSHAAKNPPRYIYMF